MLNWGAMLRRGGSCLNFTADRLQHRRRPRICAPHRAAISLGLLTAPWWCLSINALSHSSGHSFWLLIPAVAHPGKQVPGTLSRGSVTGQA